MERGSSVIGKYTRQGAGLSVCESSPWGDEKGLEDRTPEPRELLGSSVPERAVPPTAQSDPVTASRVPRSPATKDAANDVPRQPEPQGLGAMRTSVSREGVQTGVCVLEGPGRGTAPAKGGAAQVCSLQPAEHARVPPACYRQETLALWAAGARWALSPTTALGVPRKASYRAGLPTGTDIHQQREGPEELRARYPCDSPPSVMPPGWGISDSQAWLSEKENRKGKKGKQLLELSVSAR